MKVFHRARVIGDDEIDCSDVAVGSSQPLLVVDSALNIETSLMIVERGAIVGKILIDETDVAKCIGFKFVISSASLMIKSRSKRAIVAFIFASELKQA